MSGEGLDLSNGVNTLTGHFIRDRHLQGVPNEVSGWMSCNIRVDEGLFQVDRISLI